MPDIKATLELSALGMGFSRKVAVLHNNAVQAAPTLPRAKKCKLTDRTDDTTGKLLFEGDHGLILGNKIDVYFTHFEEPITGPIGSVRVNAEVLSIDGEEVAFSSGVGDPLPPLATRASASKPVEEPFAPTILLMQALLVRNSSNLFEANLGGQRAIVRFVSSMDEDLLTVIVKGYDDAFIWLKGLGLPNPLGATAPNRVFISHENPDYDRTPFVLAIQE